MVNDEVRSSGFGLRNAIAAVIMLGGLTALSVVSYSSLSEVSEVRSQDVVGEQRVDSLYSCLEAQVRHLVRPGSEVWINPVNGNLLRVVVSTAATLTTVKCGHITLILVHSSGNDSCQGLSIVRAR